MGGVREEVIISSSDSRDFRDMELTMKISVQFWSMIAHSCVADDVINGMVTGRIRCKTHTRSSELNGWLSVSEMMDVNVLRSLEEIVTDLNSLRNAVTASFPFASLASARSEISKARGQSSTPELT